MCRSGYAAPTATRNPFIDRIEPDTLRTGDQVRIYGSGFDSFRPGFSVWFPDDVPATVYTEWSDSRIITYVPQGTVQGDVRVKKEALQSNPVAIHITSVVGGLLSLSTTAISITEGQTRNITVSGGTPPYTIQVPPLRRLLALH